MKKHLIILLSLLIASTAMAQRLPKLSVVRFVERPFDTAANDERYKEYDGNGELFSIIKLASNNPDDDLRAYNFDFGLCEHRVKSVNDEVWVYIQRNAMHVTIKRTGYSTLKYELNTTVQPGKVYEMVLSADALPIYREILQFNVEPADARATIMYKKAAPGAQLQLFGITDESGSVAKSLELGTYIYEIYTDNYHKSEGRIELTENKGMHVENVVLRPNFSTVTLEVGEGVEIYINDEKVSTGTWSGNLNAGTYTVECRKDKHKNVSEIITVTENNNTTLRLRNPVPIVGALSLISRPLGAKIVIDGKDYGVTPQTIDSLLIGEHIVTLVRAKYGDETFKVEIRENDIVEKDVKMNVASEKTAKASPESEKPAPKKNKKPEKKHAKQSGKSKPAGSVGPAPKNRQKLLSKYNGYLELAGSSGSIKGTGFNVGGYVHNVNIEAFGTFDLSPATVYMNVPNSDPMACGMSAKVFGGRLGYGVMLGSRFRLTPQFGIGYLVTGNKLVTGTALTASGALRCECAVIKHLGVSIAPEYSFAISKKPTYEALSAVSSKIKGWATGFNLRIGVHFYF